MGRSTVSRFHRRGNYTIVAVASIPLTFGFMAFGLDLSYLYMADIQAGHVADAASHAAFVTYRSSGGNEELGRIAAEFIVEKNQVGFSAATVESIKFGGWNPVEGGFSTEVGWVNAVEVELSRAGENRIPLFIAPILGIESRDIYADATTAGRTREIMVVQDITGSFLGDIDSAREANLDFLDYLIDNPYPFDRYGMSVFAGTRVDPVWLPAVEIHGEEGQLLGKVDSLGPCNCVGGEDDEIDAWCTLAGYGGMDLQPQMPGCWECSNEVLGLEDGDDWVGREDIVADMGGERDDDGDDEDGDDARGDAFAVDIGGLDRWKGALDYKSRGECGLEERSWGTNPGAGIDQAIEELGDVGHDASFQAVVLITDGLPEGDDVDGLYDAAEDAVDYAWYSEGVHVWIIGYQNGAAGGGAWDWLAGLARGQGNGYLTPDAEDLDDIMVEIATSMPLTLVQ
jgi:hypothetical protein